MKLVREHIDFQRNIDPKEAMNTGLPAKWIALKKGDKLKIKRTFSVNSQNRLDDNSRYNLYQEGLGRWLIINNPPELYDDGCIGFTVYSGNDRVRSADDYFLWGFPKEFEERLEIMK